MRVFPPAVLCLGILFLLPTRASAQEPYASLSTDPGEFWPGDAISLYYDAGDADPYCEVYNVDVEVGGSDGFYDETSGYGNASGSFYDNSGGTSYPYEIDYWLWAGISDECVSGDEEGTAEATVFPSSPVPTSLSIYSQGDWNPPSVACPLAGCNGTCPWEYRRAYRLRDQWGAAMANQFMVEAFSNVSSDCGVGPSPENGYTDSNGIFTDRFSLCAAPCCSGGSCTVEATQVWSTSNIAMGTFYPEWRCSGFYISP